MNFFQRRRILKRANYLELVPVRMQEHRLSDDGKVTIVVPKFRNERFARWFIPRRKSTSFTVRLDELGSAAWLAIDGSKSVAGIAEIMAEKFKITGQDSGLRLTKFFTQLYDQRYISFTVLKDA